MDMIRIKPEDAVKIEAAFYGCNEILGIPEEIIKSETRKAPVVEAKRFICHYLKFNTNLTTTSIGNAVNIDHATVLHHARQHNNLMQTDALYAIKYSSFVTAASKFNKPKTLQSILGDVEYQIKALYAERRTIKRMIKQFN
jgi:chromosomal replication initiation ATPase DnaA